MNFRHRVLLSIAATLLLVGLVLAGSPVEYGDGLGDAKTVAIGELLGTPEKYVGQTVRVEGKITDVCPMAGCWIDIEGNESAMIRFKVRDGEIVFPPEAKGHQVAAEGVFSRLDLDREEAVAYFRHLADETGSEFDESTIEGPMAVYRIEGKGAVIH